MKTKIVYSIVSNKEDIYLEQLFVSLTSLRLHNPHDYVAVLMDENTKRSLTGSRAKIHSLVTEIIIVDTPKEYTNQQKSRFLKTSVREHIVGDYLFIDCDTIIADKLDGIDDFRDQIQAIGGVYDNHLGKGHTRKNPKTLQRAKLCGYNYWEDVAEGYINSGVLYVKDNELSHAFYKQWHQNWLYTTSHGVSVDQLAMAHANREQNWIIQQLPPIWHCQVISRGMPYLFNAKIIHYFNVWKQGDSNSSQYFFVRQDVYDKIKVNFEIDDETMRYVRTPQIGFNIPCHQALLVLNSDFAKLCDSSPWWCRQMNRIASFIYKHCI